MAAFPSPFSVRRRQAGLTLVEILVTVLVLAIGLLGLAGMHVTMLSQNNSALGRSQASALAYEIIDRMRANRMAARSGAYDIDMEEDVSSANAVAEADLTDWRASLGDALPGGDGSVAVAAGVVTVTIRWDDERDADNPIDFVVQSQL